LVHSLQHGRELLKQQTIPLGMLLLLLLLRQTKSAAKLSPRTGAPTQLPLVTYRDHKAETQRCLHDASHRS
jgi:hypothetical protein